MGADPGGDGGDAAAHGGLGRCTGPGDHNMCNTFDCPMYMEGLIGIAPEAEKETAKATRSWPQKEFQVPMAPSTKVAADVTTFLLPCNATSYCVAAARAVATLRLLPVTSVTAASTIAPFAGFLRLNATSTVKESADIKKGFRELPSPP